MSSSDRRNFIKTAAAGLAVAGAVTARASAYVGHQLTDKEKLSRIASNCWPARKLFKSRNLLPDVKPDDRSVKPLQEKYGIITMTDFPQWTKDTYPGVYHLDLWSDVFGNPDEEKQFVKTEYEHDARIRSNYTYYRWDPSKPASKKWLDELANTMVKTGTKCNHVSNNAPQYIADLDEEKRNEGVKVAKLWMDASAVLGAKTMRINTGITGTRSMPGAEPDLETGYPRNDKIVKYLEQCIKSFRELADYGSKTGVKITIENHWGLCANPLNIKIILDEVNHPFCEATPDFCNWENEYHLFHGIDILAPYTHTHVHAKYWDRWKTPEKDWNDIQRNVKILNSHGYKGIISLEYEDGPWDDIEGSKYILKEVLAAL